MQTCGRCYKTVHRACQSPTEADDCNNLRRVGQSRRYEVIRYPLYYAVIDHREDRKIVFESKNRDVAHRKCNNLNQDQP